MKWFKCLLVLLHGGCTTFITHTPSARPALENATQVSIHYRGDQFFVAGEWTDLSEVLTDEGAVGFSAQRRYRLTDRIDTGFSLSFGLSSLDSRIVLYAGPQYVTSFGVALLFPTLSVDRPETYSFEVFLSNSCDFSHFGIYLHPLLLHTPRFGSFYELQLGAASGVYFRADENWLSRFFAEFAYYQHVHPVEIKRALYQGRLGLQWDF